MPNDRASPQAVLTAPSIVTGWSAQKVADFGSVPLQFNHELQRHPLFSDEALARLIESAKREDYLVNTMDVTTHDLSSRQEGEIRDLSGQAVMHEVSAPAGDRTGSPCKRVQARDACPVPNRSTDVRAGGRTLVRAQVNSTRDIYPGSLQYCDSA